jgi:hypothetical protein
MTAPGSFAIIGNGQPSQMSEGRTGPLKPLGHHMNGPPMDLEPGMHVPSGNQASQMQTQMNGSAMQMQQHMGNQNAAS